MGMKDTALNFLSLFRLRASGRADAADIVPPGYDQGTTSERGQRPTPENAQRYLYNQLWVDPTLLASIRDVRNMDRRDGRVKKIHLRTSRAAAKGGLLLKASNQGERLTREWKRYKKRLSLNRREKLESDLRALMMEGNLCMQWILDGDAKLAGCARMPAETIRPVVGQNGRFLDVSKAYEQIDLNASGTPLCTFGLWQMTVARLQPDNYDDWGSLGRPYLDANRAVWKRLDMTEQDLVVRRKTRAPLRLMHVVEGATEDELGKYRADVERDQAHGNWRDYYSNKKGTVTPVNGDAKLDEIADIAYLLDTFFSGSPAPKGLFGYVGDLSRDVLQDLKIDFFDEIDSLQDNCSYVYQQGFTLHLLLEGLNPEAYDYEVQFAERRTDTPNQRADLALKQQALGVPAEIVWDTAGLDVAQIQAAIAARRKAGDPYPDDDDAAPLDAPTAPHARVSVTPSNAPKNESATSISTTTGG